ncbi:MAG TPA: dethiobiotin synthase [Gemmataceae bacterium]|nr:dethiobiotin synthase [Gemmataceae bacterium]
MRGLFITATDTGAGKTFVAAIIARTLREQGARVRVCKPVATGAEELSEDTRILAEAAGDGAYAAITPFVFAAPAAPPVAARLAGSALRLDALADAVRRRAAPRALLVVEGVGGLLCPLTERETVADLAAALGLPLVVVARRSLGTLNHTLLTLEVAFSRRLPVAGVVVNETTPVQGPAEETNVEELRRRIGVPLLAVVPHQPDGVPRLCPETSAVDWRRLAEGGDREPNRGAAVYPS